MGFRTAFLTWAYGVYGVLSGFKRLGRAACVVLTSLPGFTSRKASAGPIGLIGSIEERHMKWGTYFLYPQKDTRYIHSPILTNNPVSYTVSGGS